MMYDSGSDYAITGSLFQGKVNDCFVARRKDSPDGSLFTLVVIREHETVHKFLMIEKGTEEMSSPGAEEAEDPAGGGPGRA